MFTKSSDGRVVGANRQAGNSVVIVLVVLVVVAVGALAYLSGQMAGEHQSSEASAIPAADTVEKSADANTASEPKAEEPAAPKLEIKPGDPVVAKVAGQDVKRSEVLAFLQTLPPAARQLPIEQLFPLALDQVVNARIVEGKTKNVNLDSDPEVKKQLQLAKEQIVKTVYVQNEINSRLKEDRIAKAYEEYKATYKPVEEVRARHILLKEEDKAKEVLQKIKDGASFEDMAKEYSIDGTSKNGGDLGYFTKADVVKDFGDAAFAASAGTLVDHPVKSEFGYHLIKVEDKRMRQPEELASMRPYLEGQLRRQILDELVKEWQQQAKVERFNINGDAIEPASGDVTPPAQ